MASVPRTSLPEHGQLPRTPAGAAIAFASAGLILIVAYVAGLAWRPSDAYIRFQSDLVYPLAPLAALVLTSLRIRDTSGRARLGWCALTIGVAGWLVGDLTYSYYDLRYNAAPPFPGATDAIFGAGYLGFAVALPILALPVNKVRDWRWLLDAGLVLVVAAALGWVYLIEPITNAGYAPHEMAVAAAYPLADLGLLTLLVVGAYSSGTAVSRSSMAMIAAMAVFVIADSGYTYLVGTVGYENVANPLDPVWMAAYMLLGVSALLEHDQSAIARPHRDSLFMLSVPYLVVAGLVAVAIGDYAYGSHHMVLTAAATSAVALAVVRQFWTMSENLNLYRALNARTEELERSNAELMLTQDRLTTVVSNAPIVLFSVDEDGVFTLSEGAGLRALGLEPGQVVGQSAWEVYRDIPQIGANLRRALSGDEVADVVDVAGLSFSTYYAPLRQADGTVGGVTGVATDVSERERFQQQLLHLANHDPLTGLFNRRRVDEELGRVIAEWRHHSVDAALLFLDLDQFKDVNDAYGHRAGDELLSAVANVIAETVRDTDVAARLGGDEFAVIVRHASTSDAQAAAGRLVEAIGQREYYVGGARVGISVSIGLAFVGEHGESASDLLARADIAMYRAKDTGRNRVHVYDAGLDAEAESRSGWQQRIRDALAQDRFVLHAQPIVDLKSSRVVQHELLLRMVEDDGELVQPADFLGIAERSGLIVEIDRWVVGRALAMIAGAASRGEELRLSVNISGQSLAHPELLELIERGVMNGVPGRALTIEFTETAAMLQLESAAQFARAVARLGCEVALDDFGVGFSSFAQLKHLPVDYVKIDGSFVRHVAADYVDQQLVLAIARAAHALGKRVVAEFVSDQASVDLLASFGVDYGQGYHLGLPRPLHERNGASRGDPSRRQAA
jgi:diguanylate cyclase (GGDEF)-like protein/PAS domain S-box-containing protein